MECKISQNPTEQPLYTGLYFTHFRNEIFCNGLVLPLVLVNQNVEAYYCLAFFLHMSQFNLLVHLE